LKITIFSVVPSPYQRDLFRAIDARNEIDLQVYYLEEAAPDSPWKKTSLESWEHILPGFCIGKSRIRSHVNWKLPQLAEQDFVVVNTAVTDMTTQRLLRGCRKLGPSAKWIFWGELLRSGEGIAEKIRQTCSAPLNNLDAIVAIGKRAQTDYQSRFENLSVHNLPYYCNIESFVESSEARMNRRPDDRPVQILYCGQMIHRKGVDILLTAFQSLVEEKQNVSLSLVGREAELPKFLEAVSKEARERIEFHGFQSIESLPDFFGKADVFVLPSRHDGWGVVVNQAIGAGLPVVSTDRVGAACDLIQNELNGMIIPAGVPSPLFDALYRLSSNDDLRFEMRTANVAIRKELSPDTGAEKWLSIFKQLSQ